MAYTKVQDNGEYLSIGAIKFTKDEVFNLIDELEQALPIMNEIARPGDVFFDQDDAIYIATYTDSLPGVVVLQRVTGYANSNGFAEKSWWESNHYRTFKKVKSNSGEQVNIRTVM